MVAQFWEDGIMTSKAAMGVIKLVLKGGDPRSLKNWRPLTMQTTTLKIISKIIARRFKKVIDHLVDGQQTGFIRGRSILDNILAFRVGQDFVRSKYIVVVFFMIDFMKAYNKVSHTFLAATLRSMKLSEKFISLVMGLLLQSTSKVHQNGYFTQEILLTRGIQQVCPLAPLIYAIPPSLS